MVHDLRRGAVAQRHHRGAAGQRLGHHQAERLRPADRVDQRPGLAQQLSPHRRRRLAGHLYVRTEQRLDDLLEVADLRGLAHLGHQHQAHSGPAGDLDGAVRALVLAHPPDEDRVVARTRSGAVELGIDPVMDHQGHPRRAGRVHRSRGLGERAVVGGHHRDGR